MFTQTLVIDLQINDVHVICVTVKLCKWRRTMHYELEFVSEICVNRLMTYDCIPLYLCQPSYSLGESVFEKVHMTFPPIK